MYLAAYDVTITSVNLPNAVVRLGTPLVLHCTANGPQDRDISFSWAINGSPVSSSGRFDITSSPTSFQSTLSISSVMEEDLGMVHCTVSDPLHVPLSDTETITETGLLYLFGDRRTETLAVRQGMTLQLECPIRASSPATSVRWFTGSRLLENGTGVSLYRLPNGSAIAEVGVASVTNNDGIKYLCEVEEGSVNLNYTITIYVTSKGLMSQIRGYRSSADLSACTGVTEEELSKMWLPQSANHLL